MDCGVVNNNVLNGLGIASIVLSGVSLSWAVALTVLYEKGATVSEPVRISFGIFYLISILFGVYVIMNIYGRYVKACVEQEDQKAAVKQTFTGVTIFAIVLTLLLLIYIGYFLMFKVNAVAETHIRDVSETPVLETPQI